MVILLLLIVVVVLCITGLLLCVHFCFKNDFYCHCLLLFYRLHIMMLFMCPDGFVLCADFESIVLMVFLEDVSLLVTLSAHVSGGGGGGRIK